MAQASTSREQYLREQLDEVHVDIQSAREKNSWQAVAHLRRQALVFRNELDELASKRNVDDRYEEMEPDKLLDMALRAVHDLPPSVRHALAQELAKMEAGPALVVLGEESTG